MMSFRTWLLKTEIAVIGQGDLPKAPTPEERLRGNPEAMPTYSDIEKPPTPKTGMRMKKKMKSC